jgi:hypothetical protein
MLSTRFQDHFAPRFLLAMLIVFVAFTLLYLAYPDLPGNRPVWLVGLGRPERISAMGAGIPRREPERKSLFLPAAVVAARFHFHRLVADAHIFHSRTRASAG